MKVLSSATSVKQSDDDVGRNSFVVIRRIYLALVEYYPKLLCLKIEDNVLYGTTLQ